MTNDESAAANAMADEGRGDMAGNAKRGDNLCKIRMGRKESER